MPCVCIEGTISCRHCEEFLFMKQVCSVQAWLFEREQSTRQTMLLGNINKNRAIKNAVWMDLTDCISNENAASICLMQAILGRQDGFFGYCKSFATRGRQGIEVMLTWKEDKTLSRFSASAAPLPSPVSFSSKVSNFWDETRWVANPDSTIWNPVWQIDHVYSLYGEILASLFPRPEFKHITCC